MNDQETVKTADATPAAEVSQTAGVVQKGRDRQGIAILLAGVGAVLWGFFSAVGSGWGFWNWTTGITGVTWSSIFALLVVFAGIVFHQRAKTNGVKKPQLLRWIGMAIALVYVGWIASFAFKQWTAPAIHDVSTDLADPPTFQQLALRSDNWDDIPDVQEVEMRGMTPQQRWVVVHQNGYGDIRSVRINEPVPIVIAKAERLAKARGWDVALSLPEEGRLEATETRTLFRFKDDVVLRVKPTDTGEGSIIDMRSVSRVGVSDLGANAKRVRSFLTDLTGTVTAAP